MNTPDPQRLGGLAWVSRTGGELSRAERRRLFIAIALGRFPAAAARVDLDTFAVPFDSREPRRHSSAAAASPASSIFKVSRNSANRCSPRTSCHRFSKAMA